MPMGKETWRHRTVENILSNEKHKGDTRLQKCYTVDFLSKKRKTNERKVPQYYMEDSHDTIIEPAECQLVQMEIQRKRNLRQNHNCCSPFSTKLNAGTAANTSASRSDTPTASTRGRYGSATPSSKAKANASRPICMSNG